MLVQPLTAYSNHPSNAFERITAATSIELTLDYGNSTKEIFTNQTATTVYDLLNQTVELTYTEFGYGKLITSINGVTNNANGNGHYWQYWINDELAPIAADYFELSDGDKVLWKYCAPQNIPTTSTTPSSDWWIGVVIILITGGLVIGAAFIINRKLR